MRGHLCGFVAALRTGLEELDEFPLAQKQISSGKEE